MQLFVTATRNAIFGVVVLAILVFLPAGTFAYWQGWVFIAVFMVSINIIGFYLVLRDPALLARRLKAGPAAEQRPVQKLLMSLAFIVVLAMPAISALDHRLGWSEVPVSIAILGDVLVALGLMIDLVAMRANSFTASTITSMPGQVVVSSGPYALVRHPMYVGMLVMALGVPLALGSWWGLILALAFLPIMIWRIFDEEAMLRHELAGYAAYADRVRFRLMPGIW